MPKYAKRMPRPITSALKVAAVGLLVLSPVLYVLSIGPAALAFERGMIRLDTFKAVYAPILWVRIRSQFVQDVTLSYVEWCGCKYARPDGPPPPLK